MIFEVVFGNIALVLHRFFIARIEDIWLIKSKNRWF